jgi:hypothetical protein
VLFDTGTEAGLAVVVWYPDGTLRETEYVPSARLEKEYDPVPLDVVD